MGPVTIAVTGVTGYIGGHVADLLAAADIPQILVVRDPAKAPALPNTTVARASFENREAVRKALQGATEVLMVSAAEAPDRLSHHRTFVDAAVEAGVGHLVYISFYGAAPDATFTLARDHWATEQHIRATGVPFTFLRDNLYADFLPYMAGEDGVIRGPAGDGRTALVARDDIAEAAAAVLKNAHEHAGTTYELTGPRSLTLHEAARIVSETTGREVTYHPETIEEAYRSRAAYHAPTWQVDAWVSTYTAIANGELERVTDDVPRLTGHPATTLEELLKR
jgi:NAD(P)H dehydrogenase (quinone)